MNNSKKSVGKAGVETFVSGLDVESIVLEEYRQASALILQVFDDRSRGFGLYVTYITATFVILSFLFKNDQTTFEQLGGAISPHLWWLAPLHGGIHTFFFVRLGYLDKKYNQAKMRMNSIREQYIVEGSRVFRSIEALVSPERMPKYKLVVGGLFPATMAYGVIAVLLYMSFPFFVWFNWKLDVHLYWVVVVMGVFLWGTFIWHKRIAEKDPI